MRKCFGLRFLSACALDVCLSVCDIINRCTVLSVDILRKYDYQHSYIKQIVIICFDFFIELNCDKSQEKGSQRVNVKIYPQNIPLFTQNSRNEIDPKMRRVPDFRYLMPSSMGIIIIKTLRINSKLGFIINCILICIQV